MERKVYGEYQGNIKNIDEIEKLNEIELFLAISSLESYILSYKRILAYNMTRGIDITEDEYALEYLINKTEKFGVELERDKDGRIIKTGDYSNWYQYHNNHFARTLSREQFREFLDLKSKGYNVSKYLPNDSYLEYKKRIQEQKGRQLIKIPV